MEEANAQLVEAVEAGNLEMVQVALAAGADPSLSRKSVTLHVKLRNGVTKTETHLMESVLAIAIRDEKIDIVKCLLARGCDPNRPIQWKISRWHTMWTQQKWDHQRWFEHDALRYPSALNFALAWGGRGFNKRGAHVNLHNPSNADHVCDDYPLSPNTEIVKVLLSHGAQVTDSILESAWELSDRTFARILENHANQWKPPNASAVHSRSPAQQHAALAPAPVPSQNRKGTANGAALTTMPDPSVLELSRTLAEQLWINDEQFRIISDQRTQLGEQIKKIDSLQRTVDELQHHLQERTASQKNGPRLSSYGQRSLQNGHVDTDRQRGGGSNNTEKPWAGVPISVAPLPAPTLVNRAMRVVCTYTPRDSDELTLTPGDKIWCIFQFADGWGAGTNRTTIQSGFFPLAFVTTTQANPLTPPTTPPAVPSRTVSTKLRHVLDAHKPAPPTSIPPLPLKGVPTPFHSPAFSEFPAAAEPASFIMSGEPVKSTKGQQMWIN